MTWHVRTRLTLAHMGALSIALVVYSLVLFLLFRQSVYQELDLKLRSDLENFDDKLGLTLSLDSAVTIPRDPENWLTEVWSKDGRRIYSSGPPSDFPLGQVDPHCAKTQTPETELTSDSLRVRVFCQISSSDSHQALIRVARLSEKSESALSGFLLLLGLGSPLIVLLSGILGYHLAKRALRPLSLMTAAARSITTARLSERLPVAHPPDELGLLAMAFNSTFENIEKSFLQMKRFTADASHELRTPLTAIRTLGEVTLQDRGKTRDPYETLSSILEEADHLRSLCDHLILLSRADAGQIELKREKTDLGKLIEDVILLLGVLAEEKSQKIVALVEPQLFAYVDASLIKQAIINLLDNAIKYSAAATVIKIRAAVHDGTALSISVLDQGPGIPSEHHTQIFERFYRVDPSRSRSSGSGAGLGLAISSWIVQLHDGELILDSAPGRGSKFEFVIPTSIQREI